MLFLVKLRDIMQAIKEEKIKELFIWAL